jgi:hypothetical protein
MCDAIQRFANKATNNQRALARELNRAFNNNNN